MSLERLNLGRCGEDMAAARLQRDGYRILVRNYRNRFGEIDIIARDGKVLCFIEVRTRTETWHGHPFESISPAKQKKIIRAAQGFLTAQGEDDVEARFDVVAVTPEENGGYAVEIIKNAFETE